MKPYISETCFPGYSSDVEEKRHFLHDWNHPMESWEKNKNKSDNVLFYGVDTNMELPFYGGLASYQSAGYKADMGDSWHTAKAMIRHLKSMNWLDRLSRVLFIEALLYNANVNLFTTVKIVVEMPETEGFLFTNDIQSQRLYNYVGSSGVLLMILQVVWAVCILVSMWKIVTRIKSEKANFFKSCLNLFDIFDITTAIFAIIVLFVKIHFTILGIEQVHHSKGM